MHDPSYKRLNLVLAPEQFEALQAEADKRSLKVQALIRKQIENVTGVPDPIRANRPQRDRTAT